MYRILAALALASALAACDENGNPLVSADSVGVGDCNQPLVPDDTCVEEAAPATPAATPVATPEDPDIYSESGTSGDRFVINAMSYDPTADELVMNGAPFDGDDNIYVRNAALSGSNFETTSNFDAYNNTNGQRRYFAVFRRSPDTYSQVGAMGTDSYVSFGYGGAVAQRLAGDGSLPTANESYVFTGEYAAVRTIVDDQSNTTIQYVSGTVRLDVDIEDFDPGETSGGAVGGVIANREFFDANGTKLFETTGSQEFISLQDTSINFDNWTITSADATLQIDQQTGVDVVVQADGSVTVPAPTGTAQPTASQTSGTWEGLFAGPEGQEIAGVVLVEGTGAVGIDDQGTIVTTDDVVLTDGNIRETGIFIGARP